jgi:glycosyltransferase involved in cell wall biosynthesis
MVMEDIKVKALMITGKDKAHLRLALSSVKSFLSQTYQNKELIIINDGYYTVKDHIDDDRIIEYKLPIDPNRTLGELRNISLDKVDTGEYWVQWDDDDWHREDFIEWFMTKMVAEGIDVAAMNSQVRHCFEYNNSYVHWFRNGKTPIAGTLVSKKLPFQYPTTRKGEDSVFVLEIMASKYNFKIVDTSKEPELYLRFIHGNNTWNNLSHFYGNRLPEPNVFVGEQQWPKSKEYLNKIIKEHYSWLIKTV